MSFTYPASRMHKAQTALENTTSEHLRDQRCGFKIGYLNHAATEEDNVKIKNIIYMSEKAAGIAYQCKLCTHQPESSLGKSNNFRNIQKSITHSILK